MLDPQNDLERLGVHVHADRWVVVLDRPEKLNAIDETMRDELWEVLTSAAAARMTVALGGRGRAFCSGGDLESFGRAADPVQAHVTRMTRSLPHLVAELRPRLEVFVRGACYGAGLELAAAAGWIGASAGARFSLPERSMGLIPGSGGTVTIPKRIGHHMALELFVTSRVIDADESRRIGLIDEIIEDDDPRWRWFD